jgi:ABC-type Fe3+/spermidine/putrescine transport system ATPase subunit
VLEPEIILLDEPLSNLDAELRVSMRAEIRALQRRLGITAVYVTHDQEEALAISDQVVVMNAGRIEQVGPPEDIYARPRTEFVARFMGFSNVFPLEQRAPDRIVLLGETYTCTPSPDARQVVVRSETVQLSLTSGRHHATIEDAIYLGARMQYVLRLADGHSITIDQPSDAPRYPIGGEVRFDVRTERLHFL